MKKTYLLSLIIFAVFLAKAQPTTNYGLASGVSGVNNSFFGWRSGFLTIGNDNSFVGSNCGPSYITGGNNSIPGSHAFFSNSTGSGNAAVGYKTLYSNTDGALNSALGSYSLYSNTAGHYNSALGAYALYYNTTGIRNTATGFNSMALNTTGRFNTATGFEAMYNNATGEDNAAMGYRALALNTTGNFNVAVGFGALGINTNEGWNTAVGYHAGPKKSSFYNCTAIGNLASPTASNSVRIGNSSVNNIGGYALWSSVSDGRFKRDIKEDISGLEFINQLRPISYTPDRKAIDKFLGIPDSLTMPLDPRSTAVRQTGFVAQEVEAIVKKSGYVFGGVEAPQNENDHYSIRYAEFVVPLVKAVQELSAKLQEQQEVHQREIFALKQQLGINTNDVNDLQANSNAVLFQNNPNPFSFDTEIKMTLPEATRQAHLTVYNMEGKQLKNIQINDRNNTSVKISGSELPAGMYLYALIVDGKVVDTKRLVLTR